MKNIMAFVLAFCVFSAHAGSNLKDTFQNVINNFNYAMTVEWDQKDQKFLKSEKEKLNANLMTLMKSGLNPNEVLDMFKGMIQDNKTVDLIELELSLLGKNPSEEKIIEVINRHMSASTSKGASWSGNTEMLGFIIIITLIAGLAISVALTCGFPCDNGSGGEPPFDGNGDVCYSVICDTDSAGNTSCHCI